MTGLFQSFLLSFSILWRFLIVMPLWLVAYAVLAVVMFFLGPMLLGVVFAIPLIGIIGVPILVVMVLVFVGIISIHPYLIATRQGLQVLGVETTSTDKGLLKASIGYGIIVGLCLSIANIGVVMVSDLIAGRGIILSAARYDKQVFNPMLSLAGDVVTADLTLVMLMVCLSMMALRALVLPVLAGAAAGNDPNGQWHTPFNGIGSHFLPLMGLLLLISALIGVALMGLKVVYGPLSSLNLMEYFNQVWLQIVGVLPMNLDLNSIVFFITVSAIGIWLFCWQCAAAALTYSDRSAGYAVFRQEQMDIQKAEAPDIGELLRARMPGQSG